MSGTGTHHRCDGHNFHPHVVIGVETLPVLVEDKIALLCDRCLSSFGQDMAAHPPVTVTGSIIEMRSGKIAAGGRR